MILSLPPADLAAYVRSQLDAGFPDGRGYTLDAVLGGALERLEHCFANVSLPRYTREGEAAFDHLHGDQTAVFYYLCANEAHRRGQPDLAAKLFLLNKQRNGIVCMYDTELPPVFAFIHTVGTVVGKAHYGNYVAFFQGVTVGADRGVLPVLGERCVLYANAVVVGGSRLGSGVVVAGNSAVIHEAVPDDSIVAGRTPNLTIAKRTRDVASQYFFGKERVDARN